MINLEKGYQVNGLVQHGLGSGGIIFYCIVSLFMHWG